MTDAYPEREPDQLDGVALPEFRRHVVGHAEARGALFDRLDAGRLPGGVLIHGPRGIGKATLAFDFARAVFTRTGDEPAEHVAAQVESGAYPNLFVLRKAAKDTGKGYNSVIRVDEIRHLVEQMRMTRGRAGQRIAIIDAIDDCNTAAANALLKILEEPPADSTFLLISHRPGSLLPTIRSRCFRVAMRPLASEDVREVLATSPAGASGAIEQAVGLADGRPRRGFEALLLSDESTLSRLTGWLRDPVGAGNAARLALADALAAERDGSELRFARDMLFDWMAKEAREAALSGPEGRRRLASVQELWDKARLSLADADAYNLDMRQTLVGIFDAIRKHQHLTTSRSEP